MPTHPNAVGYLQNFGIEEELDWVRMICDLAGFEDKASLTQSDFDLLIPMFRKQSSYIARTSSMAGPAHATVVSATDTLEVIGPFSHFKRLDSELKMVTGKRISLVFGANGSGKSSLCDAFRILAAPQLPTRPIHNVFDGPSPSTGFDFKFGSDPAPVRWNLATGFGTRSNTIKYFDTTVAVANVKNAVEPGRIVELTPFNLQVFENTREMLTEFRRKLQQMAQENLANLGAALAGIALRFDGFDGFLLARIDESNANQIETELEYANSFCGIDRLQEMKANYEHLKMAVSDEGLRLMKAETGALRSFVAQLKTLIESADQFWATPPFQLRDILQKKESERDVLAKSLVPTGQNLERLLSLARAASTLCPLEDAIGHQCPLCKQNLGDPEVALFRNYAAILSDSLEKNISDIRSQLEESARLSTQISAIKPDEWDSDAVLSKDFLTTAREHGLNVINHSKMDQIDLSAGIEHLKKLRSILEECEADLTRKQELISSAERNRGDLLERLYSIKAEVNLMDYAMTVHEEMPRLQAAVALVKEAEFWEAELPYFTNILRKLTTAAKLAHRELVVPDFEARLNAEYLALTERDMNSFGVRLRDVGGDGAVTVNTSIGDRRLDEVLSEGEQRMHALALFFAELETCGQSVIILDDPVSSFDFNYTSNFCNRLRDFTANNPSRRFVILTHNWEFFVNLQGVLNGAQLNHHTSVQVLESCTYIREYVEKPDELKSEIAGVLGLAPEPTRAQKEELAGKMRRLVESIVNTHVFNNQRQQYRQRKHSVSEFHHFTKLVPLLAQEATELRDLYAKLSITEHDDARAAYVNTTKATFQARFTRILAIETAVLSRR